MKKHMRYRYTARMMEVKTVIRKARRIDNEKAGGGG